MSVAAEVSYRDTRDGVTLLQRTWLAEDPVGSVVIVHGLGEHGGRYQDVATRLVAAAYDTMASDLRSFGRSGGRTRSYVDDFEQFLDDLEDELGAARHRKGPLTVLGHSMGGLIAVAYAVSDRPQPDAYVISAPPLGIDAPRWQRMMSTLLTRWAPRLSIPNSIDSVTLSRDVAVQRAYDDDPLVQHKVTVRLGAEMFDAMDETVTRLHRVHTPMLVLHGAEDQLVPARFSAALGGVRGVRRELLPGLRHEIFNEPEGPEVVDRLVRWMQDTLG